MQFVPVADTSPPAVYQSGTHNIVEIVMATPVVRQQYDNDGGNRDPPIDDPGRRKGAMCLIATCLGFGILFCVVGVMLVMFGYLSHPLIDDDSAVYDEEVRRLKNCRTAGWVVLSVGTVLLLVAIIAVIRWSRQLKPSIPDTTVSRVSVGDSHCMIGAVATQSAVSQFAAQPSSPYAPGIHEAGIAPFGQTRI